MAETTLTVGFKDIDWAFLQSIYGWAALQYQAWARGTLVIGGNTPQTIRLYTPNLLEFWIDDKPYFGGDLYAYRRAPLLLELKPGNHRTDLRLIRDVRMMGGVGEPQITIMLEAEISTRSLAVMDDKLLVPDMVGGRLASTLGSVPVCNESEDWINIYFIQSYDVSPCATGLSKAH